MNKNKLINFKKRLWVRFPVKAHTKAVGSILFQGTYDLQVKETSTSPPRDTFEKSIPAVLTILQLSNREVRHERMFKIGMMWIMKMCIKNRNTLKEISNM